jgi:hypothetical protein
MRGEAKRIRTSNPYQAGCLFHVKDGHATGQLTSLFSLPVVGVLYVLTFGLTLL